MRYGFSHDDLHTFVLERHRCGGTASESGAFADEILRLPIETLEGPTLHALDEGNRYDGSPESIGAVKLLREGARITAAAFSPI